MGSEVHHHLFVSAAEDPGVSQGRDAGSDLDGDTTGIIEDTILKRPSVAVPHPVGQGAVDQGGPAEAEHHARDDPTTLGDGSHSQAGGNGAEHHLVEGVEEGRNQGRTNRWSRQDPLKPKMVEVADVAIVGGRAKG